MKNNNLKLSDFVGELNFAFCPTSALIASDEFISKNKDVLSIFEEYDIEKIKNIKNAFRYFYICYSISVENINQENKDYFYFQLFLQIGDQQSEMPPIYGFFSYDEIMSFIRDIDAMFVPSIHEKQIFESYTDEIIGTSDIILSLMQDWTTLKLLEFKDLYFRDEDAVFNLYKTLENLNNNTKKPSKSRARRKKESQPADKTKKTIKKTRIKNKENEKSKQNKE